MAIEIERKFLIKHIPLNRVKYSHHIKQGYIVNDSQKVIRVRKKANQHYLTIKGNTIGISRSEFEYAIPRNDAENLFDQFCLSGTIEKTRHYVANKNHLWEIDEFHGRNDGLIVAEIELDSEDEFFEIPNWIDKEVTSEKKYYNMNLLKNPYTTWAK